MKTNDDCTANSGSSECDSGVATSESNCCSAVGQGKRRRKDAGRLHSLRHAVLSRYPLEALRHLGEDVKALRRLEKHFRAELKPVGAIAEVVFDRFWSSYLRCVLAARTEANVFLRQHRDHTGGKFTPRLVEADVPALLVDGSIDATGEPVSQDMLRELALVQRYDRHFAKEMYRALALLLVLRSSGEFGLEIACANAFGVEP